MKRFALFRSGFTVVEVLISITVIAILAVVLIFGISGVRTRASVSSIELGASAYMRAIKLYHAENGHFPLDREGIVYAYGNVSVYGFCVGESSSYPNPHLGCGGWTLSGGPTDINKYKPTDGFHREIMKVIDNQSSPKFDCFYVAANGSCARGYVFLPSGTAWSSKLDGKQRAFFGFFLPGRQPCRLSGELAMTNSDIGWDIIRHSQNYSSKLNKDYTFRNNRFTLCLYAV